MPAIKKPNDKKDGNEDESARPQEQCEDREQHCARSFIADLEMKWRRI